jgi:hypothetical protein
MTVLRFSLVLAAALSCAGPALARASAAPYPRITQARDAKACGQALAVARRAFASAAPKLADAAPFILNENKPDFGIMLAPAAHNPDADDFILDESAIERETGGAFRSIFRQKAPSGRARFVVTQQKMNWQGDWYGLYLVDVALDLEKTSELLAAEKEAGGKNPSIKTPGAARLFDRAWQRPWLLRDPKTSQWVGIDTQHPAAFFADWIVYKPAKQDAGIACRIAFRPPAKRAADLLPAGPARKLALLLDTIIGVPAQDEGTYHATDRVHVAAAHAVANLALRPWALEEPYNSAEEIEKGLAAWMQRSPVYRAQYRRAKVLYPQASRALTSYYRRALRKSPQEAAALAKESLARAYGAHFVFPKSE